MVKGWAYVETIRCMRCPRFAILWEIMHQNPHARRGNGIDRVVVVAMDLRVSRQFRVEA